MTSPDSESKKGKFWLPPIQRQRWGDDQVLPHVNWGDLFFDLFYVAAAYNLAYVLKTDKSGIGFFYFLSCFGNVFSTFWHSKTFYDAKFGLPEDVLHPLCEVLQLCGLASAVLHIRPVEYMSLVADNPETFLFCLANLFGSFHSIIFNAEIKYIWVDGDDSAKHASGNDLKHYLFTGLFTLAATIYSGLLYYTDIGTEGQMYHGPMIIMLAGWFTKPFAVYLVHITFGYTDFKRYSVPMNVDFLIHRYGEWTMLMLGESILSLLIVNDISDYSEREFYTTFYLGIVSVTLLQFLYFKSQPHSADYHAMRRSRLAGIVYGVVIQYYSAALIVVGVSYKMLLIEYSKDHEVKPSDGYENTSGAADDSHRWLAGSSSSSDDLSTSERQKRIALMFGCGLGTLFICLDLLLLAHNGFASTRQRCRSEKTGKFNILGFFLVVVSRYLIVAFIVVICLHYTDPMGVAWLGFAAIVMQIIVRITGKILFPRTISIHENDGEKVVVVMKEDSGEHEWPNVSHPGTVPHDEL